MINYMFDTSVTMKEYNRKKWWIDSKIISPTIIQAENLKAALQKFVAYCDKMCITISNNALKNKNPMYIDLKSGDVKQIGYVITGQYDFQDNYYKWSKQYINLWVRINEVNDVNFDDMEN